MDDHCLLQPFARLQVSSPATNVEAAPASPFPVFHDTSSESKEIPKKLAFRQRARSNAISMAPPEKVYHQDYIARIRYSNALPPPPGDPKLLNIPCDGLEYYTSAAFASRMARSQPLNVEPDGDLGMPIDLVGMPRVFDGDESCKMIDTIL